MDKLGQKVKLESKLDKFEYGKPVFKDTLEDGTSVYVLWDDSYDQVYISVKNGIIELPGSFAGISMSEKPQRGPQAKNLISFPILIKSSASALMAPIFLILHNKQLQTPHIRGREKLWT